MKLMLITSEVYLTGTLQCRNKGVPSNRERCGRRELKVEVKFQTRKEKILKMSSHCHFGISFLKTTKIETFHQFNIPLQPQKMLHMRGIYIAEKNALLLTLAR
jgi:hypothetical protein